MLKEVLGYLRPLTDDPSFWYEKLVRETWYKKLRETTDKIIVDARNTESG